MPVQKASTTHFESIHCEVVHAMDNLDPLNMYVICMDRTNSKHNIIDRCFALDLARAVYSARRKAMLGEIDVVVVCSAKDESFMAGADIFTELKYIGPEGAQRAFKDAFRLQSVFSELESLSVPTIALLNGTTLGGGLELALACDYRIADSDHCKQIGLPEVKLGVVPGGGGCVRLPRLIGLRCSLELLITGKSINSHRALHLGVVDTLMENTGARRRFTEDGSDQSYEYPWLLDILELMKTKTIGKKPIAIKKGVHTPEHALPTAAKEEDLNTLTEENLFSKLSTSWNICEKKAAKKYPSTKNPVRIAFSYVLNIIFYLVSLVMVWSNVGLRMPAPYVCLLTTFRCFYAGSWLEAMIVNASGFASVVTTAESKSLMNLFHSTRQLKKVALQFGLEQNGKSEKLNMYSTVIVVLVSEKMIKFSSAFVQSILYSKLPVHVIDVSGHLSRNRVTRLARELFQYSIVRGHTNVEEVNKRISLLTFHSGMGALPGLVTGSAAKQLLVVNASSSLGTDRIGTLVSQSKDKQSKLVFMDVVPGSGPHPVGDAVLLHIGDPVRNNTLCIEVAPLSDKTQASDLRAASALISAIGKVPVLIPATSDRRSPYLGLCLHHWNLAVCLRAYSKGLTEKSIDSMLRSVGFGKGPFEVMRKLDPNYIHHMVHTYEEDLTLSPLKSYLTLTKSNSIMKRNGVSHLSRECVIELFLLSLSFRCLLIKKHFPTVPEAGLDALCVSGLIQFPPSEGGPLSYLVRNGAQRCRVKLERLSRMISKTSDLNASLSQCIGTDVSVSMNLFQEVCGNSAYLNFDGLATEGVFLTADELGVIGPCCGVVNREVFLYPVLFIVMLLLLEITVVLCLVF